MTNLKSNRILLRSKNGAATPVAPRIVNRYHAYCGHTKKSKAKMLITGGQTSSVVISDMKLISKASATKMAPGMRTTGHSNLRLVTRSRNELPKIAKIGRPDGGLDRAGSCVGEDICT